MLPLVRFDAGGTPELYHPGHPAQSLIQQWLRGEKLFEIKTSGSTGPPKTIIHTREALLASALNIGETLGLQAADHMHVVIDPARIGGMMQIIRALVYKMNIYIYEPHINVLEDLYITEGRHHISVTPPMLNGKTIHPLIRSVLVGGAAAAKISMETCATFPGDIYETYGMTETCSNLALKNLKQAGSRFIPLPGWKLRVGADGVLLVQHDQITTQELYTGDLVERSADGSFLYLGRADHIINSGSRKYIPEVLEQSLTPYTSEPIFISSVPDALFGAFPVLMCLNAPPRSLRDHIIHSKYQNALRYYIQISDWPLTPGGKIDRNVLKIWASEAQLNNRMRPF